MFDVNSIIQSSDLRQMAEKAGTEIDNHGRGKCPLHGGDNDNAFSIFHKDGRDYWKCFTADCGSGDVITFVQKWQGLNFKDACAFLVFYTVLFCCQNFGTTLVGSQNPLLTLNRQNLIEEVISYYLLIF